MTLDEVMKNPLAMDNNYVKQNQHQARGSEKQADRSTYQQTVMVISIYLYEICLQGNKTAR